MMMYAGTTRMVDDEDRIIYLKNSKEERKYVLVDQETFNSLNVGDKCDLTKIMYETNDLDYVK